MSDRKQNENLVPFKKGYDPNRAPGRGGTPLLDTEEKIELFAEALANGATTKDLEKTFSCSRSSVKLYRKDPRVKAAAMKYIEDRVLQITRITDKEIAERLSDPDEIDIDTLLKIRKEFLGGAMRLQTTGDTKDPNMINEAMQAIESDPEFAAQLTELLAGKS